MIISFCRVHGCQRPATRAPYIRFYAKAGQLPTNKKPCYDIPIYKDRCDEHVGELVLANLFAPRMQELAENYFGCPVDTSKTEIRLIDLTYTPTWG